MKYRLLALDLDGTLLDPEGNISPANHRAVREAREAGVLVVLCTGRGLVESRRVIEALDHHGPIIVAGGAMVSDPTTGKTLHKAIIEPTLAGQIVQQLNPDRHAVVILLDPEPQDHDYLVVSPRLLTSNTRWWFEMIGAKVRQVDRPGAEDLHHVVRVGIVAPSHVMPPVQESIQVRFGSRVMVQYFTAVRQRDEDIEVLEVFAEGVSKWSALQWLAAEHQIDAATQIAAIGDQINDISMVANAACGVAMGNAVGQLTRVAKHITASNADDGVAVAINRMISGQW